MLVHAGGVVIQMSSHKGVKLLHYDSSDSIQLCQSNKSAKAGPAIWGGAQLQSSNHPVSASNSLTSAGAERSWCKRRQDIIQPCCFPCKKRKVWASILAKLPLKPYIRRINLISKLQFQERWCVSHMHFHGMHALSESFPRLASHAPLPHLRPRNQNRSVPSFGAWSVMNICRKLGAWSHDIHQGSVSLPEYLTNSWSSYCMGFELCRFQKKLLLSSRVWWIPDENTMLAWAILKEFQFWSNLAAIQKFNASILAFKNSWSAVPLAGKPELFAERCTSGHMRRRRAAFDFCSRDDSLVKRFSFFLDLAALEWFNVPSLVFQNLRSASYTSTTLAKWRGSRPFVGKTRGCLLNAAQTVTCGEARRFCPGTSYSCLQRWHQAPFPQKNAG